MGRAGLNRKTALATLTLTLAAEAPDLDIIGGLLRGPAFGFAHHRGFTHSFLGVPLDFTNNYGIRPFWPFSEKWYSWDIVFIVEPIMLAFLILGLILPLLFGLIDREIGARRRGPHGRVAAILALAGIVLYDREFVDHA